MKYFKAAIKAIGLVGLLAVLMNLIHHAYPAAKLEGMYLGMALYMAYQWALSSEKDWW